MDNDTSAEVRDRDFREIEKYEVEANKYYGTWFAIYIALGISAVALPAAAAAGINFGAGNFGLRILAACGSIAAATAGFLKPHDYATGFDAAIAELRILKAEYDLLTPKERAARLRRIFLLMTFKYGPVGTVRQGKKSGAGE